MSTLLRDILSFKERVANIYFNFNGQCKLNTLQNDYNDCRNESEFNQVGGGGQGGAS